jgi:Tfp pilus assembly protein PilO
MVTKSLELRTIVAVTALALAACLAGEWALVRPVAASRDHVRSERLQLQRENAESEAVLARYEQFLAEKEATDARYREVTAAIPSEAELPAVLEALRSLAIDSRVQLVRFTPTSTAKQLPARKKAAETLARCPIRVDVRGNYQDVKNLFLALSSCSRLLTVDRFDARTAKAAGASLDASLDLTCYFRRGGSPSQSHGGTR